MEKFYQLTIGNSNRYAEIEHIYKESEELLSCNKCGSSGVRIKYPLKAQIYNTNKKFGDFMLCCAKPLTIVSQRVVDFLEREQESFEKHEVILYNKKDELIEGLQQYYVIEGKKEREYDVKKMNTKLKVCEGCGWKRFNKDYWDIGNRYLIEKEGLPSFFYIKHWKHLVYVNYEMLKKINKEKFIHLGVMEGIENFNFSAPTYSGTEITKLIKRDGIE